MDRQEFREEYARKEGTVCESLREGRMILEQGASVCEVFTVFKGAVVGYKHRMEHKKGKYMVINLSYKDASCLSD